MTTVIVKIPDKKASMFASYFKKHRLKTRILKSKEDEDMMAKWIDEGMKSGEVSEKNVLEILKKNGVKI
ncbi:MAG TPA: hypothetical protein VI757_09185 [Bacteroidia bacterium]|nr:hypothetical protein [Bacteroidia bacterium]